MEELLSHIGEVNTFKKLQGDYIFYSTRPDFWKNENVETVEQFEHWQAKDAYETAYRAYGNKGFLPFEPDKLTTEELRNELDILETRYGKL